MRLEAGVANYTANIHADAGGIVWISFECDDREHLVLTKVGETGHRETTLAVLKSAGERT